MRPPEGTFKGTNIMTPTWEAYYKLAGDEWAELTTGRGIEGAKLWGVTVRQAGGGLSAHPSKLCYSRREALAYIAELTYPLGGVE